MRNAALLTTLLFLGVSFPCSAQAPVAAPKPAALPGPSNEKAQKAFDEGQQYLKARNRLAAIDSLKKAVKLDPQCMRCAKSGIDLAIAAGENKQAWEIAQMLETPTAQPSVLSYALYEGGVAMYREGAAHDKRDLLERAHGKFIEALKAEPHEPALLFADGMALAYLKEDDQARERFQSFLDIAPPNDARRSRVQRYLEHPELARARLAPNFSVTALDGSTVSMDDLQGKVVLLDFWATWCGPCNEELPHVKQIAAKYAGRPLVVLSVSWDRDENKWKQFVATHGMDWTQVRDADHKLSELFAINAIPHYFTIDTDSILQSEQLGGGTDIDGKLKKLVAAAEKKQQALAAHSGN